MNVVTRGVRNAFRNTVRTSSIIIILGLSIGLTIAMLAARQAVTSKIQSVKSSVGTSINISPAGFHDFSGGGTALTAAELAKVAAVTHVTGVTEMLSDRLSSTNTNLVSSIESGALGQRFGESGGTPPVSTDGTTNGFGTGATRSLTPPVTVTGTNDVASTAAFSGSTATITSGKTIDATSNSDVALVGKDLATKNSLSVGSTFTAYGATVTVTGVFDTGTTFGNNAVVMPLATVQRLSDQAGSVTSASATVDSLDNLASATTAIKSTLGTTADVTNSQDVANQTVQPLESVKSISLFSLIGAMIAGAIIILLTMMMIVRERRREIGVMKAIGASNLKIMGQFIAESLTLTVLGLVVGSIIGIAAASPVTNTLVNNSSSSSSTQTFAGGPAGGTSTTSPAAARPRLREFGRTSSETLKNIKTSVGISTLMAGIGAALFIAIVGSAVPSFLISKIKPAEAMRSE